MRLARSCAASLFFAFGATSAAFAQPVPPAPPTPAPAAAPLATPGYDTIRDAKTYAFVPHSTFFSALTSQPAVLDPQVFVADPKAPAATGPQEIAHVAGYRPAFASDPTDTPLANANGDGIKRTLGQWLGGKGALVLAPVDGGTSVAVSFSGLVPKGRYSLFEDHFTPGGGITVTPLDGTGLTNSFTASPDGTAKLTVVAPGTITHAEGISVIYHSDGLDHGTVRGMMGLTAHDQMVFRLP
jgi:hypothetical protein